MLKVSASRTRQTIYAIAALMAIALAAVTVNTAPSKAQAPPPILAEPLTPRSVFTDDVAGQFRVKLSGHGTDVVNMKDLSRTIVVRFTVQPGARFPWHSHPGLVVVNVAQGELVYVAASDCVERAYPAGTAFVDPGHGHVHTAFNRTEGVTVLYATFFDFPETGPLSITEGIEEPADCNVGP
jgi:quercetin dioxygenase-like cupin family protein